MCCSVNQIHDLQSSNKKVVLDLPSSVGGWIILEDLLNERVAEGDTSNPHDFNVSKYVMLLSSNSEN